MNFAEKSVNEKKKVLKKKITSIELCMVELRFKPESLGFMI